MVFKEAQHQAACDEQAGGFRGEEGHGVARPLRGRLAERARLILRQGEAAEPRGGVLAAHDAAHLADGLAMAVHSLAGRDLFGIAGESEGIEVELDDAELGGEVVAFLADDAGLAGERLQCAVAGELHQLRRGAQRGVELGARLRERRVFHPGQRELHLRDVRLLAAPEGFEPRVDGGVLRVDLAAGVAEGLLLGPLHSSTVSRAGSQTAAREVTGRRTKHSGSSMTNHAVSSPMYFAFSRKMRSRLAGWRKTPGSSFTSATSQRVVSGAPERSVSPLGASAARSATPPISSAVSTRRSPGR